MRSPRGSTSIRQRRVHLALLGAAIVAPVLVPITARAGTVTVFAAASLGDAFRTIGTQFEAAHPGTKVELNFAGSSTLARQIMEGARADVFASADEKNLQKVVNAGDVAGPPQPFASNRLAIIVPRGNPKKVSGLGDLARGGMVVSLAAAGVPVGDYAREAFGKAGVAVPDASQETDVKAVVTRVAMGEADAGVVYVTDVAAGGEHVGAVDIPEAHNVTARYPIAVLREAPDAAGGRAFVTYVLSPAGQRVLRGAGFLAP